jgi:hypothetical protein
MAFAFVAWRRSIWQLDQPIRESAYLNWATPSPASTPMIGLGWSALNRNPLKLSGGLTITTEEISNTLGQHCSEAIVIESDKVWRFAISRHPEPVSGNDPQAETVAALPPQHCQFVRQHGTRIAG